MNIVGTGAMATPGLQPGWNDPVHEAQVTFRAVLKALAEPGLIQTLPIALTCPPPLQRATGALLLALADFETPVWLNDAAAVPAVQSWLKFHCGCPLTDDAGNAAFAVYADLRQGLDLQRFSQGSMEYPDRSTTLLIQVQSLDQGPPRVIAGPGIPATRMLHVGGLPENFDHIWQDNHAAFPLGVDLVFCSGNALVAMPRTARIVS
jgi:alpha-D-ribose 1-methylphosphonate 5-triphosphate synthase subunit PhnH